MILATVLRQAEKRGYDTLNVAKLVDRPEVKQREATILTLAQINTLLDALRGERFETFLRMSIMNGLRKGEILGLRWQDIDFEAQTVTPRYQVTRRGTGVEFTELKTKKSTRIVPIDESLMVFLREWRREQLERG